LEWDVFPPKKKRKKKHSFIMSESRQFRNAEQGQVRSDSRKRARENVTFLWRMEAGGELACQAIAEQGAELRAEEERERGVALNAILRDGGI
jgi:hypothetical protein